MSFDDRVVAFAERFMSDRMFRLVVEPAVADLQFEHTTRPLRRAAHRLAVLRAVGGGLRDDLTRALGGMLVLTLLPACYYIFLLVICFDVLSLRLTSDFVVAATLTLVLSFGPVMACFWPARHDARTRD